MEDFSSSITELSCTNRLTWFAIVKTMNEAEGGGEVIETLNLEGMSDLEKEEARNDRVQDAQVRLMIMTSCGPEALSRILHLQAAREQWEAPEAACSPLEEQQENHLARHGLNGAEAAKRKGGRRRGKGKEQRLE